MQLYIIPSWYPTDIHPENGSFFRDRALMLSKGGTNVTVMAAIQHSLKDILSYHNMTNTLNEDDGMDTYVYQTVNIYPRLEKCAFQRYQKFAIKSFNQTVEKKGNPDVVLFNSSLWAAAALAEVLQHKNITFFVSEHLKEFMPSFEFSSFQTETINRVYNKATAIIAPSKVLQRSIMEKFPNHKNKIIHLPNPVDEDVFSPAEKKNNESKVNFISVGLFRREKNIDVIVDAFARLIKQEVDTHLTLVGDGPLRAEVENKIRKLNIDNHITLTGYIDPLLVAEELKSSDILLSASSVETFGMSILEAQSCGIPVIATDCGGPVDIINDKTGILIDAASDESLASAMMSMINNLSNYDSTYIREQVVDRFGKSRYNSSIRKIILISI